MVCWAQCSIYSSEISIYHQHNNGELEREKSRKWEEQSSFLAHELNTNWNKAWESAKDVCNALISAVNSFSSFFHCNDVGSYSHLLINGEAQPLYHHLSAHIMVFSLPSLSGSHSLGVHFQNIHHWASVLCLRLNSIHPNICVLHNLQEELNNLMKTNQAFIKWPNHCQPNVFQTSSELSAVTYSKGKTYGVWHFP